MGTQKFALLAAALLASPLVANADVVTWSVSGYNPLPSTPSGAITGTFSYDTVTQTVSSANLTATGGMILYNSSPLPPGPVTLPTGVLYSCSSFCGPVQTNVPYNGTNYDEFYISPGYGTTSSEIASFNLDFSTNAGQLSHSSTTPISGVYMYNNAYAYNQSNPNSPILIAGNEFNTALTFVSDVPSPAGETSPVPLPAAAWLMLSGLGGLGAMARKKHAI